MQYHIRSFIALQSLFRLTAFNVDADAVGLVRLAQLVDLRHQFSVFVLEHGCILLVLRNASSFLLQLLALRLESPVLLPKLSVGLVSVLELLLKELVVVLELLQPLLVDFNLLLQRGDGLQVGTISDGSR